MPMNIASGFPTIVVTRLYKPGSMASEFTRKKKRRSFIFRNVVCLLCILRSQCSPENGKLTISPSSNFTEFESIDDVDVCIAQPV